MHTMFIIQCILPPSIFLSLFVSGCVNVNECVCMSV